MIPNKYLQTIKDVLRTHTNRNARFFIFGSAVNKEHFGDVDIGADGAITDADIARLKEAFTASRLPYVVDVININKVSEIFKKNIFNNSIIWIQR